MADQRTPWSWSICVFPFDSTKTQKEKTRGWVINVEQLWLLVFFLSAYVSRWCSFSKFYMLFFRLQICHCIFESQKKKISSTSTSITGQVSNVVLDIKVSNKCWHYSTPRRPDRIFLKYNNITDSFTTLKCKTSLVETLKKEQNHNCRILCHTVQKDESIMQLLKCVGFAIFLCFIWLKMKYFCILDC